MNTHNIGFYEEISKIIIKNHQICTLYLLLGLVRNQEDTFSGDTAHVMCNCIPSAKHRKYFMSRVAENLTSGFPTRSDTNRAVLPRKIHVVRGLKFGI